MLGKALVVSVVAGVAAVAAVAACGSDNEAQKRDGAAGEVMKHGLTKEKAAQVLVKVGDRAITLGEFAERLADQSPYLRARYNSPERRREFLDNMIRFELLAAEARRRGLDKLPDVERTRKQVMIQQMMKADFEDRIRLQDVTEDEIRAYYDAHPDEFNKPEQVRASHILIKDRAKAQRVLAQILASPTDVALFRRLAEQNNEDSETRDRMGDLRFFSRSSERQPTDPNIPAAVAEAVFALQQVGDVHRELVRSDQGFHIVKLTGKRAALRRSLEEARRPVQNRLWREKREHAIDEFIAQLRREANVQESFDLLADVHIDVPAGTPPEMPLANGDDDEGASPFATPGEGGAMRGPRIPGISPASPLSPRAAPVPLAPAARQGGGGGH